MTEVDQRFLAAVVAIGVFGLLVAALYAGDGMAGIRRQRRQLVVMGLVLAVLALVLPTLERFGGAAFGALLVAGSLVLAVIRFQQRRNEPIEVAERRRALMRSSRGRLLMAAVIVFGIFVALLAATLGRLSR